VFGAPDCELVVGRFDAESGLHVVNLESRWCRDLATPAGGRVDCDAAVAVASQDAFALFAPRTG
jgi:hypothetical protein